MIYFDNSATTPISAEVLEAMLPYLKEEYGNPSSKYYTLAENARKAVEDARKNVADLINGQPSEVIFTSGASESNNLVIKGIADFYSDKGNHIITSCVEHKSVLETCKYLETKGYEVTFLQVNKFGQVEPETLKNAIKDKTILVSIMWGNNEIGTINDIDSLARVCHEKEIFFHSDATQVLGKVEVDLKKVPVNFLSFSAHKFHGPKGVGGCFIRKHKLGFKTKITPLIHGGKQENDYRSGTLAVHDIVGMGKAAELAKINLRQTREDLICAEKDMKKELEANIEHIIFNGHPTIKIPGIINVTIPGINNELLIRKLASEGIAISTGSACSANEPSYVLSSIGLDINTIRSSIRISLSVCSKENIITLIRKLKEVQQKISI